MGDMSSASPDKRPCATTGANPKQRQVHVSARGQWHAVAARALFSRARCLAVLSHFFVHRVGGESANTNLPPRNLSPAAVKCVCFLKGVLVDFTIKRTRVEP